MKGEELKLLGKLASRLANIRAACDALVKGVKDGGLTDKEIDEKLSFIAETAIRETIQDEGLIDKLNANGVCF
ncbi:MAG: hypothetical protein GY797_24845 [Deltaproteobacteria bacterium]|nr:hypothetical protein [Deltaproteobacteria bacterium]